MKSYKTHISLLLFTFSFLAGLAVLNGSAITLSITPSSISNTYSGKITLVVGGLPSGGSAVVQKYLDHNANGVVDAGDMLFQQFTVTDGQWGMVIGGVTNINVPGDSDTTAGQITCKLHFPNGDFSQSISGNYLFVVSSPTGAFSPVTNSFSVTNFPFPQKLTGKVLKNGVGVPGAIVVVFPPPSANGHGPGQPVEAAAADNSGNYTVPLPVGTYMPLAVGSNLIADAMASPIISLAAGQTISTNLVVSNATTTITGHLVDYNNSGIPLPGIFLAAMTKTYLIAATSTDSKGNFTMGVDPGTWNFDGEPSGLILHGYVGFQGRTNVLSGSSFTGAFPQASALFYGQVVDASGNPLSNIDVNANDNNGQFQSDSYTDNKGNYCVAALGGLPGDTWNLSVSSGGGSSNPTNYLFTQPQFDQNGGTNITAGQAVQVNFTGIIATNIISGNVQYYGTNIVGVGIYGGVTINGQSFNAYMDTDANGNYSFNVCNGLWSIGVNQNGGSDSLDNIIGPGNYSPPSNLNIDIVNDNGIANFTIQPPGSGGGPLQINTTSLPNGNEGASYYTQLQASGGLSPYIWSLASGSLPLPNGLTLGSNGVISGVPTTNNLFNFFVQVTDSNGTTIQQSLGLIINPKPSFRGSAKLSNGQFQVLLYGAPNQNYSLQMTTNLSAGGWVTLYVTNNPLTNTFPLIDSNATNRQRFYRVLVGP